MYRLTLVYLLSYMSLESTGTYQLNQSMSLNASSSPLKRRCSSEIRLLENIAVKHPKTAMYVHIRCKAVQFCTHRFTESLSRKREFDGLEVSNTMGGKTDSLNVDRDINNGAF